MPAEKDAGEPSEREKQVAHGAQSDQGGQTMTTDDPRRRSPPMYEGPEESQQQRRDEPSGQRKER